MSNLAAVKIGGKWILTTRNIRQLVENYFVTIYRQCAAELSSKFALKGIIQQSASLYISVWPQICTAQAQKLLLLGYWSKFGYRF